MGAGYSVGWGGAVLLIEVFGVVAVGCRLCSLEHKMAYQFGTKKIVVALDDLYFSSYLLPLNLCLFLA